jgi:peptidyl-prolyl cis-trans isomerase SurA
MKKLLFIAFAFLMVIPAMAQPKKIVADKIVGIVGDHIILYSDIKNAIADISRQGGTVPEGAECQILEQSLVSKVLMLQAMKDSLVVTEEEVEADLDMRVREFIRNYGSQEAVEQLAGKSIYQIKDDARESVRERKLAEAMQAKVLENVRITPSEVKVYFDRIPKDSLPFFESELEVGQIAIFPKASKDLEQYAINELTNYRKMIDEKRISFENAAKRYSDDPGSKDRGGQYQLNRNEKSWDPAFLAASFRLKEGEISPIIKSKFGYHIIQMVQRTGDDAVIRHILKIPPVTQDEMNAGLSKLDSVRSMLIAGTIDFNAAVNKYSEIESQDYYGPLEISNDGDTYNRIDELDKDIVATISKIKIGEYSQPQLFTDPQTQKQGVRIIYLKSRSEPHVMNIRDDYNKIQQAALEEKKYLAMEKWLSDHIKDYYIMIDTVDADCPQLKKWTAQADLASK